MTIKSLVYTLIALLLFTQCDMSQSSERRLPRHSGESGEIIVVMPEGLWLSNPGDSLRTILEQTYPQLPQPEPYFNLLHFAPHEMSDLLRHHRNIVKVVIGPDSEGKNNVGLSRDKWSKNQLVFTIRAEDEEKFYSLLHTQVEQLVDVIDEKERARYRSKYRAVNDKDIEEKIAKDFKISITIPRECEIAESSENFMWVKRERIKYLGNSGHDITQGFFIYRYPYTSDSLLSQEAILAKRDAFLKKYVPGPNEGTYMTTEYRFEPSSEIKTVDEKYNVYTHGLWRTENYFMGGPFVQRTTTSNDGKYVICVSGFVFAPKFKKREYIREIEAILQSVNILE